MAWKNRFELFILFIIATVPFNFEWRIGGKWVTTTDIMIMAAVTTSAIRQMRARPRGVPRLPEALIVGLLLFLFVISSLLGINVPGSIKESCKYLLVFGYMYVLVNEIEDGAVVRAIPNVLFISSFVVSAWFLADFFLRHYTLHDAMYVKNWDRHPFSAMHFNQFGSYLALTIPFGVFAITRSKNIAGMTAAASGVMVQSAALILTYSRINLLTTVFIVGMIVLSKYGIKGRVIAAFSLIVPLFLLMTMNPGLQVKERLLSTLNASDGSRIGRAMYSDAAVKLIEKRPVWGVGPGNFREASKKYLNADVNEMVHNTYLQIWVEAGIFSLAIFVLLIIRYFLYIDRILPVIGDAVLRDILMFVMFAFAALIISNQYGDPFVRVLKEHFALLLALPYVIEKVASRKRLQTG